MRYEISRSKHAISCSGHKTTSRIIRTGTTSIYRFKNLRTCIQALQAILKVVPTSIEEDRYSSCSRRMYVKHPIDFKEHNMADKFKKGDIVEFNIGSLKLSGNIVKAFHSRKRPTAYLVMTDYQIVEEKDLRLKE